MTESSNSLDRTPTWVIAAVCFVIILISLCAERGLHKLEKWLVRNQQIALCGALQKLQEELMVLGFISLLLTVFQDAISHMCIPTYLASRMLPCKRNRVSHEKYSVGAIDFKRRLLSSDTSSEHCANVGKVPLLSLEALHELHIFIFVLAVVHVIFCATTMVLGGIKMREWKNLEEDLIKRKQGNGTVPPEHHHDVHHYEFFWKRTTGYWRRAAVVSWLIAFFKQFYGSVTHGDYIALRQGFKKAYFPEDKDFNFYEYITQKLEEDFRKVVGIRWHLWLFVVIFLLLNVEGWHTFFWLSFLPLVLLLLVGAKLGHIITRLALEAKMVQNQERQVKPSDEHFWFNNPGIFLDMIHFILFQNAFEIAFFFWILCTYGIRSCIMERLGYIIPRLIIGVIVQVLCSYSTLPLYALVTQMGSKRVVDKGPVSQMSGTEAGMQPELQMHKMAQESYASIEVAEEMFHIKEATASMTELSCVASP